MKVFYELSISKKVWHVKRFTCNFSNVFFLNVNKGLHNSKRRMILMKYKDGKTVVDAI